MEKEPSQRKPNRYHRGQIIRGAIAEADVLKEIKPPDESARAVLRGLRISVLAHIAGRRGLSEEEARRRVGEFYPPEEELGIGATDIGALRASDPTRFDPPEPEHWNNWRNES